MRRGALSPLCYCAAHAAGAAGAAAFRASLPPLTTLEALDATRVELVRAVTKLRHVEQASEVRAVPQGAGRGRCRRRGRPTRPRARAQGAFTCLCCMEPLSDPVAVAECGHVVNRACVDRESRAASGPQVCPECRGAAQAVVPLPALEDLASKHTYRLQALDGLERTAQSLKAPSE